eukprot:CAMPEP_0174299956 /NCGR_PEP_ID=MMETSP0809-20121228/58110_1 /TAXON_ID=73025 ORGANISM="Eutreptiella gymnastica-like, Strain CCMP1594" /NCGR_SAMPLE_ID=MMETSP0809 /ASSEMBLY_ACC=CAM_ASM_000658 /LENGTH=57 /DNA_ID=CAMNT_0015405467 /DNA_START=89 /DNA_END=258 /DNA_ORIENTATION=-
MTSTAAGVVLDVSEQTPIADVELGTSLMQQISPLHTTHKTHTAHMLTPDRHLSLSLS